MTNFDKIIKKILANEGGYVNHPNDPGGETKYGITHHTARANGFKGEMKDLTLDFAKKVYKNSYYNKLYDQINSVGFVYKLVDAGINMGKITSVMLLQEIIDVKKDGIFGAITLSATNSFIEAHGEEFLIDAYCKAMKERYILLINRNSSLAIFQNGWFKRAEKRL